MVFKAAGPVFLGKRRLPPKARSVVDLVAPVMLIALVVTQTVGGDEKIVVDARIPGVAAAGRRDLARSADRGCSDGDRRGARDRAACRLIRARSPSELRGVLPAPEDSHGADRLGCEAEDADHEKPQSEVPHAIQDRPKAAPS